MLLAAANWLARNPEQAQELARFNPPAEMPLAMLSAVEDVIPSPGAPAAIRYQLRLHIPALAHHPWPEYLAQLREITAYAAPANPRDGAAGPRPHICRCVWEIHHPQPRPPLHDRRTG